jgi:hypothetical protein
MSPARLLLLFVLLLGGCATDWQGEPYGGQPAPDEPVDPDPGPLDADGDGVPWPEDCHDGDAAIFPGAAEACDGLDNDCSGVADDVQDGDGDGFGACDDCDDADPSRHPDRPELCGDGEDDDCDGLIDEDIDVDADGDGIAPCQGDCDDADPDVFPGAPGDESPDHDPNGVDDDCDGLTDEGWDLPCTDGELWVASELRFGLLTGSGMADLAISDALADLVPPTSDLVALLLDPTSDVAGLVGFSALVGLGVEADGWGWRAEAPPLPTSCWRLLDGFDCDPVPLLTIPVPGLAPLVLRDVALAGELYAGTDVLFAGTVDAVVHPDELPALPTPAGDLAELVAQRPFDVDSDGDGLDDAWSTLLAFAPLETP